MIWNLREWRIWTSNLRMSSPWSKKFLNFDALKCSQNEGFDRFFADYFHHFRTKFWFWCVEIPQNVEDLNRIQYLRTSPPCLKKILDFNDLKCPWIKKFELFLDLVNFFLRELNEFAISYHFSLTLHAGKSLPRPRSRNSDLAFPF